MLLEHEEFAYNKLSAYKPLHSQECKESSSEQKPMSNESIMFIVPKEDSSNLSTSEATSDQRLPPQTSALSICCSADSGSQSTGKAGKEEPQMSVLSMCHPHLSPTSGPSEGSPWYSHQSGAAQPFRDEEEYRLSPQSNEEELEAPLPLRSEEDWGRYNPCSHHGHCYSSCSGGAVNRYPAHVCPAPAPLHQSPPWHRPPHPDWLFSRSHMNSTSFDAACSVSVNVPHFSVPPAGGVSQASVGELAQATRIGGALPEECRNIFITYSSDASSEIPPFAEFLTKHGFRPTIDMLDIPLNCTDINSWRDGFLKDPSTLIIIAVSPKYKADIEGTAVDRHGLHNKYIHSMMQNEFIQQGSLNFRFIPVLFLSASQEHVPSWLQNTGVYHWPHHTEDLLLRLLRRERYAPPPVAMELNVIIKPVPLCAPSL